MEKEYESIKNVKCGKWTVVYHSLLGMPVLMNDNAVDIFYSKDVDRNDYQIDDSQWSQIEGIKKKYFEKNDSSVREALDEQAYQYIKKISNAQSIDSLSLYVTTACNFGCKYCIHFSSVNSLEKKADKTFKKFMSFDLAKESVDIYMRSLRTAGKKHAEIEIIGGEPLLNWEVVRQVLDYTYGTYQDEFDINFGIVSNLTLLTDEIVEYFKKYKIPIFTSLDGEKEYNDKVRVYKNGAPTYDDIFKGIKLAKEHNHPIPGFNFTLSDMTDDALSKEYIEKVLKEDFASIHGDYNFMGVNKSNHEKAVKRLLEIFKIALDNNSQMNGTFSCPFVNLMNGHYHKEVTTFCDKLKGNNFSVTPEGELLICNYVPVRVGNIHSLQEVFNSPEYKDVIRGFLSGQKKYCRGCAIEGVCSGGCPAGGAIKEDEELINREMCYVYQNTFIGLIRLAVESLEKGDSSTRKLFYRSKELERILSIMKKNRTDKEVIMEPLGGIRMNLCSGGLAFDDSNKEYSYWYRKLLDGNK